MAGYKSPYAARIAALSQERNALADAELPEMFTPEEKAARQRINSRQLQMAILGQLTGDKVLGNVGEPLLKGALAERTRRITEHGEYNPLTGDLKVFPEYMRRIKQERLDREQARLQELEGKGQDAFNLAKERAADRAALAAVTASNQGTFQAGTDLTPDGRPIVFHNKSGKFAVRDDKGNLVEYNGPRMSRQDFGKETTALEGTRRTGTRIADLINRVEENQSAFGSGIGGAAVSLLPESMRGIATNQIYNTEEQILRAAVFEEAYQVAKELAGTAQSLNESVRLEPFTPRPGDPYEVVRNKLQAAQIKHDELLKKLETKRAAAGISHKPGPETPKPSAINAPVTSPTPDSSRKRLTFDPATGELK